MRRVILSLPSSTWRMVSASMTSSASSAASKARLLTRTISMRLWLAITLRVSPSMMSSRRDCAPRSSRSRWKKRSGLAMRQRA